jgi:hypothetical protein
MNNRNTSAEKSAASKSFLSASTCALPNLKIDCRSGWVWIGVRGWQARKLMARYRHPPSKSPSANSTKYIGEWCIASRSCGDEAMSDNQTILVVDFSGQAERQARELYTNIIF